MSEPLNNTALSPVVRQFVETDWGEVARSQTAGATRSGEALSKLCQTYWYPLYCFVRRQGKNPHDAQDLVQGFFAKVVEKNYFKDARREKGRLRTFLLVALTRYMANEWDRATRQKRGGGREIVSLSIEETETRYRSEPVAEGSLEKSYNREWATTLLNAVLSELEGEWAAAENGKLFGELKVFLTGEESERPYAEIAEQFGMAEGTLRGTVFRLRQRYREILVQKIGETVETPEAVEGELRELFVALS